MNALADQVALVTGGASGIGRAVVRRFVHEGCRVGVVDLNAAALSALQDELSDRIVTIVADIRGAPGNQLAVHLRRRVNWRKPGHSRDCHFMQTLS